jgi:hypothetical protein
VVPGFVDANLHGFDSGYLTQAIVTVDVSNGALIGNQLCFSGNVEKTVGTAFGDKRYISTAMGVNPPHVGLNQSLCDQSGLFISGP